LLLSNLLSLNGHLIVSAELELGDRGVFYDDHEVTESILETVANLPTDLLTIRSELVSSVASDDRSQDLIHDRRQDTSVVIISELSVDIKDFLIVRSEHNSESNVDHLQVRTSSLASDVLRSSPDVVLNSSLKYRDLEVEAFTVDSLLHSGDRVEFEGTVTRFN